MLTVEDWAEIRRLYRAEGLGIKTIARTLGIARNTVRAAIASVAPPKYQRRPVGSAVDAFEDAIREQLTLVPTMPATVIVERVGWTRGITVFKERVAELRPAVSAGGPGQSYHLRGRRCRAARPVVPADRAAGGVRPDPQPGAVAGADHGDRLLPLAVGDLDPDPARGGPVRRVVALNPAG